MDNFLRFEYILRNFYIKDIFNNDLNPIEFNNICNKFNATFLARIYTNNIPEDIHMYFKLKNIPIINRSNEILFPKNKFIFSINDAYRNDIINDQDLNLLYDKFNKQYYYDNLKEINVYCINLKVTELIDHLKNTFTNRGIQ